MTTTFNFLSPLFKRALSPKAFALFFLLLCLSASSFASLSSPLSVDDPKTLDIGEAVSLSIQLNKKTIQVSSLEEQSFPMLISSKINKIDLSSFPQNPVDLVCVFEIKHNMYGSYPPLNTQIEDIRALLRDLRPLMTDQDRLAVVLFYNPCGSHSYYNSFGNVPITNMPSLVSTNAENWETIISTIGEKMIQDNISTIKALKAAKHILSQRGETNRTTGIFISPPPDADSDEDDFYGCWYREKDRTMEEIDLAEANVKITDPRWIIQTFSGEPKEDFHAFAESLVALRAGIVESKLLVKLEKSKLLQDARVSSPYFHEYCKGWEMENGTLVKRNPSAKPGKQQEYGFDLVIPKITTQGLPFSPIEVKVASYQLVFLLNNGSEVVVKNKDLMVKIVREGETAADEEEDREVVKEFYRRWAVDWLINSAWREIYGGHDYERAHQILGRYRKVLDGSIVKDDEMLKKIWKDAEVEFLLDQESGVEYD